MPLYNNPDISKAYQARVKKESAIDDLETAPSDRISLVHDEGAVVKTSLDEGIVWDPYNIQIGAFIDCKNNPPYPKAHAGSGYLIIGAGMFGTIPVVKGDIMIPLIDVEESKKASMGAYWTMIPFSGIRYNSRNRMIAHPLTFIMTKDKYFVEFDDLLPWNHFTLAFLDEIPSDFKLTCQLRQLITDEESGKSETVVEDIPIDIPTKPMEITVYPDYDTTDKNLRVTGTHFNDLRVKITIIPGI